MAKCLKHLCFLLAFFNFGSTAQAQLSFQLSNYNIKSLNAGNQNWDIDTDNNARVFVANNHGLLVIENSKVSLYELKDHGILRSVAFINDTLYTGSFEEFGYWITDDNGKLTYSTLTHLLENPAMNNDEIWKIVEHDNIIYFHSFGSIYAYDGKTITQIPKEGSFMFLHKAGSRVFTQKIQGELYELADGKLNEIRGSGFLYDEEVKSVVKWDDSSYLIATTAGVYWYKDGSFTDWDGEMLEQLVKSNINTMIKAGNKLFIGTILNGLFVYDNNFQLLEHINTENQLPNNTILSLESDQFGNIWVGLDRGLAYIAFDMPLQNYNQPNFGIGSVYAATLYQNDLYVGTNQGVYQFNQDENGNYVNQSLIPGTQGQVWFLKVLDDKLYAGMNDGTYIIEGQSLERVSEVFGGYTLKSNETQPDKYVQSTYSDLLVFEYIDSVWQESYTMSNFSAPARFLEFDHLGNIWLGHAVRGIFKAQPNMQFTNIEELQQIGEDQGLPTSTNRLFKLNNRIMTSHRDTLYQWDSIDQSFVPFYDLTPYFTVEGTVKNILSAGNQRYWVVKDNEIALLEVHFNSIRLLYRIIPNMYGLELVENYEKVIPLSNSLHLICLDNGFSILNLDLVNAETYPTPNVEITEVTSLFDDSSSPTDIYNLVENNEVKFSSNTLHFSWTSSQIAGIQAFFQYRLIGLDNTWSNWTTETSNEYLRLPAGDYGFQVRSIGVDGSLSETAEYNFVVKKPWYLSEGSFVLYAVLLISFALSIRLYLSRKRWLAISADLEQKHKKMRQDQEQAEKEIIKLTNEKLQSEVEHKSAQLASNTMAMMRKNNLLSTLKEELDKQKKELGSSLPERYFQRLNRLIDDGMDDEHGWEVFEQLYDQAHGDFFKRLKETYPQLTPSDLRLCAYLRMNLSSKEIAPLLNISVRGVEERRYRLRKRLNLSTNTNLNELIMTF